MLIKSASCLQLNVYKSKYQTLSYAKKINVNFCEFLILQRRKCMETVRASEENTSN